MAASETGEFDLIRRFFTGLGPQSTDAVALSVGDDCALLNIPAGKQLAMSIDTMVAGRHFPVTAKADDVGYRALAVAVSDLAAMAAEPLAFTLALSLPESDEQWLQGFSEGLAQAATDFAIPLVGGDTTKGPLTITVQVHGAVSRGGLRRSGAKAGDRILVTGSLGDAAAALAVLEQHLRVSQEQMEFLHQRFYRPKPPLQFAAELVDWATAAIDVSDGLLADVGHIAAASGLAAYVQAESLPHSLVLNSVVDQRQAIGFALAGGDDYELCFTVAADQLATVQACCSRHGITVTEIGEMRVGSGVHCRDGAGQPVELVQQGYKHF